MKYADLFTLNPIETVIDIADADKSDQARRLVSTFVLTPNLATEVEKVALPILDPKSGTEGKGLFVVGSYGTGKSHLMSFLSIIAERAEALEWLKQPEWKDKLRPIAGQYCVRRYELNVVDPGSMTLYDVIANQLAVIARLERLDFVATPAAKVSNPKDEFSRFMEAFEAKHPGKGVLLICDEVLDHLRKLNDAQLVRDLAVLRALGEFADGSRLKFMAGVQRSLFASDEFRHISTEIARIRQRFNDIVIDSKGVEQLIETYLFEKNQSQRDQIKAYFARTAGLYDVVGRDLERFTRLFPAHPRFIEEFERVTVVERREILKVLTVEAKRLADILVADEVPELITADCYWRHIERDSGLDANLEVRKVKQNVATLKDRINLAMVGEDREPAKRLVEALGVNRLTTSTVTAQVGLTPEDLKENLLWHVPIPMQDQLFLTQAVKRTLEKTREAANGQFLAKAPNSDHYFIDPTLSRDFEQEVATDAKVLAPHVVQRYLNELILRALEIENEQPVAENRLWGYTLDWVDKNVERPGWFFFGFPNLRLTAQPPKDFYIFITPSIRIENQTESFMHAPDEVYWFLDGFPSARYETKDDSAPETWLDNLRLYVAARERASRVRKGLDEHTAFSSIAERRLKDLLPEFNRGANEWVSVQHGKDKKTLGTWIQEVDPSNLNASFRTKLRSLTQVMLSAAFAQKYRDYPSFPTKQTEESRLQNARMAQEIVAQVGLGIKGTEQGRGVLRALGLYQHDKPTYDQSHWLKEVQRRLDNLADGQYLNISELVEERDGRKWFRGEVIEAEWLMVVLTAGVAEGDLVIVGTGNNHYDATKMEELFAAISSPERIVRIAKPKGRPVEAWKRLFEVLGLGKGELAHESRLDTALTKFVDTCNDRIGRLVMMQEAYKVALPFQNDEVGAALAEKTKSFVVSKEQFERLKTLNSRAKMPNLNLGDADIVQFGVHLKVCDALEAIVAFSVANEVALGAVGRYKSILEGQAPSFKSALCELEASLNEVYADPFTLEIRRPDLDAKLDAAKASALKSYQDLHKWHRLDPDALKRKQRLIASPEMKCLNKLAGVESLGHASLDAIHRDLEQLVAFKAVSDEQLLKSPTALHPDGFDPRLLTSDESAADVLIRCEGAVSRLYLGWQGRLVNELGDPSVRSTLSALGPSERTAIEGFLAKKTFPHEIDNAFLVAVNNLLKGLRKKPVKREAFTKAIFGDGIPLRPEELRQRVEDWIKAQTQNEDAAQVRFVVED